MGFTSVPTSVLPTESKINKKYFISEMEELGIHFGAEPQPRRSSPKPLISSQVGSSSLQPCPPHGPPSCFQQVQMLKIKRLLNPTLRVDLRSGYTAFQSLKCLFIREICSSSAKRHHEIGPYKIQTESVCFKGLSAIYPYFLGPIIMKDVD